MRAAFPMLLCLVPLGAQAADSADKPSFNDPSEKAYLARAYLFLESPTVEAYVRSVLQKLVSASASVSAKSKLARVPDVFIYSADEFNASTDVDGNLLISTRALRELESEDELAALLGHELAHLMLRHNQRKSAMRSFPVGVETAGWVAAAADRSTGDGRTGTAAPGLSEFGKDALANTQAASLVWSDILMPGWNRGQERAADRTGLELMRAAGYDPAAFGTLFSKLAAAQARRSERMEALRKVAEQRVLAANKANPNDGLAVQVADKAREKLETVTVDALFDGLTQFNRDYDPPKRRQELLSEYADEKGLRADKRPRSPRLRQQLREGGGGAQLAADRASILTMDALNSRNTSAAQRAVAPILPRGGPDGDPLSPHLNLALATWYIAANQPANADVRVRSWIRSRRPPAQAYILQAYLQWNRKQYGDVIKTLERGRRRTGTGAPFLPYLVSAARANGQKEKAESYVAQCAEEDRKGPNAVVALITFRGSAAPTGIYPECVRRLGYAPERPNLMQRAVSKPVELGKKGVEKVKGLFRREKPN